MIPWEIYGVSKANLRDIPGEIAARSAEEFFAQFRELLDTAPARTLHRVFYFWLSQKPVPRTKGESRILYIGKTDGTMRSRHRRYAGTEASGDNWLRYAYMIETYGPMTFTCALCPASGNTPREVEKQTLASYFQAHLEYPPINASR